MQYGSHLSTQPIFFRGLKKEKYIFICAFFFISSTLHFWVLFLSVNLKQSLWEFFLYGRLFFFWVATEWSPKYMFFKIHSLILKSPVTTGFSQHSVNENLGLTFFVSWRSLLLWYKRELTIFNTISICFAV